MLKITVRRYSKSRLKNSNALFSQVSVYMLKTICALFIAKAEEKSFMKNDIRLTKITTKPLFEDANFKVLSCTNFQSSKDEKNTHVKATRRQGRFEKNVGQTRLGGECSLQLMLSDAWWLHTYRSVKIKLKL